MPIHRQDADGNEPINLGLQRAKHMGSCRDAVWGYSVGHLSAYLPVQALERKTFLKS